jgi:hypothetical protein
MPQCPHTTTTLYIKPFKSKDITEANQKHPALAKYGFHLGLVCTECGQHTAWIKQEDSIVDRKFLIIPN